MAGGKETPRQKMIGMMYLVLTALLALQVSSAVLEKFAIINVTLDELLKETETANDTRAQGIVEVGGKSPRAEIRKEAENAMKVRELTKATLEYTAALKKDMLARTGKTEIDEEFIQNHGSDVATMMIDPRQGKGKEYEEKLNAYVAELSKLSGEPFEPLAKAPKDMEQFKDNTDHAKKDFVEFMFENTPPIAAYASVAQMETEIAEYEARALTTLEGKVGKVTIKADLYFPVVIPMSNTVVAGQFYEGDLFLAASSSAIDAEFSVGSTKLETGVNEYNVKYGKVKFRASSKNFDKNGLADASFDAHIKLKDSLITRNIKYKVAEPIAEFKSAALQSLYRDCGNELTVGVRGLESSGISLGTSDASANITKGAQPGIFVIEPTKNKVNLVVRFNGEQIGRPYVFETKTPPMPTFVAKNAQGQNVDPKAGISRGAGQIRIVANVEESFKAAVPRDANFRPRKMEVGVIRAGKNMGTRNVESSNVDLGSLGLQPGDVLYIEVQNISRSTYKGDEVPMGNFSRQFISMTVKN
jgi:gliding motility-associated protein GldM